MVLGALAPAGAPDGRQRSTGHGDRRPDDARPLPFGVEGELDDFLPAVSDFLPAVS
jgi:hypothetical protein